MALYLAVSDGEEAGKPTWETHPKEKHQVLGQVLDLLAEPTLPAQMVRPSVGDLIWVVDEAAATGQD